MPGDRAADDFTLALSTTLEEDFVSPLTAMRGALEILRDYPDLSEAERQRFLAAALDECQRLTRGVEHLAASVYEAGRRSRQRPPGSVSQEAYGRYLARLTLHQDLDVVEVDLDGFEFSSSRIVNDFYDVLDQFIEGTGRRWFLVVNYRGCSIWPEAWVAMAHRGKKVSVSYSLGTVRYAELGPGETGPADDLLPSREAAFEAVARQRAALSPRERSALRR